MTFKVFETLRNLANYTQVLGDVKTVRGTLKYISTKWGRLGRKKEKRYL